MLMSNSALLNITGSQTISKIRAGQTVFTQLSFTYELQLILT